MTAILTAIIELLVGGITGIASGIGTGLNSLVTQIFLTVDSAGTVEGLSTFGSITIIFMGVSLAIGLCRWVINWVTSLGH